MSFIYKSEGLIRLYFSKMSINCFGIIQNNSLRNWRRNSLSCHYPYLRYCHGSKNMKGPGLKDFLMAEQITNYKTINHGEYEKVPYIADSHPLGHNQKVFMEVYGCQMNVNDTEIVLSILKKNGYQRTSDVNDADIILIVTCSIRDSAEMNIWNRLKELRALKKKKGKRHLKIGILGCMAERLKNKVLEIDKIVDVVAGPDSYKDLPRLFTITENNQKAVNVLLSLDETYADVMPVRLNENDVTAYVSIMRGCDNMCSYCIVPFTRGRERSRPLNSIEEEVKILSGQGIKQITLLGQNVNSYRDTSCKAADIAETPTKMAEGFQTVYKQKIGGLRFHELLDRISQIDPEMRIRFTSPHPKDFPDEILHLISERKNICSSLHLPVQSGSTVVLERMRRGYTREAYIKLVERVRNIIPNVALTTDIISGFCGETEEDHEATLDLIRLIRYNFIYFFSYSMREKTTAHRRYVDDVPKEIKKRRIIEIGDEFRRVAEKLNQNQVNQTQLILVEGFSKKSDGFLAGRNDGNIKVIIPATSVPSSIRATDDVPIKAGDYVAVAIKEAGSQVLKGVPLHHTSLSEFDESAYSQHCRIEIVNRA